MARKQGRSNFFYQALMSTPEDSYQGNESQPMYKRSCLGTIGASIYEFSLNKKQLLWNSSLSNQMTPQVYATDHNMAYDWDEKRKS